MTDRDLLIRVQKIQELMVMASTGRKRIEEVDDEYKSLYFEINSELIQRKILHRNEYSSLWYFYAYWKDNLTSYHSRRVYVRDLYNKLETNLYTSLAIKKEVNSESNSSDLSIDELHEQIILKCKHHMQANNYEEAALNALKLIEVKVKEKSQVKNEVGVKLMRQAFNIDSPIFEISEDRGEREGWQHLLAGLMGAVKNPHSHNFIIRNRLEAFQILAFCSYLLDFLDNLQPVLNESYEDDIPF